MYLGNELPMSTPKQFIFNAGPWPFDNNFETDSTVRAGSSGLNP